MINYDILKRRKSAAYRVFCGFLAFTCFFTWVLPPGYAQSIAPLNLPAPGTMVTPTAGFTPAMITGITIHPENPLEFDFIVGTGDEKLKGKAFEEESTRLIKYFLAALTVPEEEMWVNLSPYEKDRIIPEGFGTTEMGRDLLAQDYILKQLTASLMYPEKELGKKFWDKIYRQAREKYGTAEIPVNTFNKVWIVPEKAVVYESGSSAFVVKSRLRVMLEEDYQAMNAGVGTGLKPVPTDHDLSVSTEIIREVILPEIEKEVNEGKSFANLRQIYNSAILAAWFKQNLRETLLGQVYVDKSKTKGVDVEDKTVNEKIYAQYLEAFKKGVYNYIKEDYDPATQEVIPRKYFSGGANLTGLKTKDVLKTYKKDQVSSLLQKQIIDAFLAGQSAKQQKINTKLLEWGGKETGKTQKVSSPVLPHPLMHMITPEMREDKVIGRQIQALERSYYFMLNELLPRYLQEHKDHLEGIKGGVEEVVEYLGRQFDVEINGEYNLEHVRQALEAEITKTVYEPQFENLRKIKDLMDKGEIRPGEITLDGQLQLSVPKGMKEISLGVWPQKVDPIHAGHIEMGQNWIARQKISSVFYMVDKMDFRKGEMSSIYLREPLIRALESRGMAPLVQYLPVMEDEKGLWGTTGEQAFLYHVLPEIVNRNKGLIKDLDVIRLGYGAGVDHMQMYYKTNGFPDTRRPDVPKVFYSFVKKILDEKAGPLYELFVSGKLKIPLFFSGRDSDRKKFTEKELKDVIDELNTLQDANGRPIIETDYLFQSVSISSTEIRQWYRYWKLPEVVYVLTQAIKFPRWGYKVSATEEIEQGQLSRELVALFGSFLSGGNTEEEVKSGIREKLQTATGIALNGFDMDLNNFLIGYALTRESQKVSNMQFEHLDAVTKKTHMEKYALLLQSDKVDEETVFRVIRDIQSLLSQRSEQIAADAIEQLEWKWENFHQASSPVADKVIVGPDQTSLEIFLPDAHRGILKGIKEKSAAARKSLLSKMADSSKMVGWKNWPVTMMQQLGDQGMFREASHLRERINRREIENIIIMGIGGSAAPIEAELDLFFGRAWRTGAVEGVRIFILDTPDEERLEEIRQQINISKTAFVVNSKSGGTLEPAVVFRVLKPILQEAHQEKFGDYIYVVTDKDAGKSALRREAEAEGYHIAGIVPDDMGGRFSIFSAIGMFSLAVLGRDVEKIALGVKTQESPEGEDMASHMGWLMADAGRHYDRDIILSVYGGDEMLGVKTWGEQLNDESVLEEGKGAAFFVIHNKGQKRGVERILDDRKDLHIHFVVEELLKKDKNLQEAFERRVARLNELNIPQVVLRVPRMDDYYMGLFMQMMHNTIAYTGEYLLENPDLTYLQEGVQLLKNYNNVMLGDTSKPEMKKELQSLLAGDRFAFGDFSGTVIEEIFHGFGLEPASQMKEGKISVDLTNLLATGLKKEDILSTAEELKSLLKEKTFKPFLWQMDKADIEKAAIVAAVHLLARRPDTSYWVYSHSLTQELGDAFVDFAAEKGVPSLFRVVEAPPGLHSVQNGALLGWDKWLNLIIIIDDHGAGVSVPRDKDDYLAGKNLNYIINSESLANSSVMLKHGRPALLLMVKSLEDKAYLQNFLKLSVALAGKGAQASSPASDIYAIWEELKKTESEDNVTRLEKFVHHLRLIQDAMAPMAEKLTLRQRDRLKAANRFLLGKAIKQKYLSLAYGEMSFVSYWYQFVPIEKGDDDIKFVGEKVETGDIWGRKNQYYTVVGIPKNLLDASPQDIGKAIEAWFVNLHKNRKKEIYESWTAQDIVSAIEGGPQSKSSSPATPLYLFSTKGVPDFESLEKVEYVFEEADKVAVEEDAVLIDAMRDPNDLDRVHPDAAKIFREYDLREHINNFTPDRTRAILAAQAVLASRMGSKNNRRVLIAADQEDYNQEGVRIGVEEFTRAGFEVTYIERPITSPTAYMMSIHLGIDNIAFFSASHNPYGDKGLKIGIKRGTTLGPYGTRLLKEIASQGLRVKEDEDTIFGTMRTIDFELLKGSLDYYSEVHKKLGIRVNPEKFHLVINPIFGTSGYDKDGQSTLIYLLEKMGFLKEDYTMINGEMKSSREIPGEKQPNPELKWVKDDMQPRVKEVALINSHKITLGVPFDRDSDRMTILDANVQSTADKLGVLAMRQFASNYRKLHPDDDRRLVVYVDMKASLLVFDDPVLKELNVEVRPTKTGHSYLKWHLRDAGRTELVLGAFEQSGHSFYKIDPADPNSHVVEDPLAFVFAILQYLEENNQALGKALETVAPYVVGPSTKMYLDANKFDSKKTGARNLSDRKYQIMREVYKIAKQRGETLVAGGKYRLVGIEDIDGTNLRMFFADPRKEKLIGSVVFRPSSNEEVLTINIDSAQNLKKWGLDSTQFIKDIQNFIIFDLAAAHFDELTTLYPSAENRRLGILNSAEISGKEMLDYVLNNEWELGKADGKGQYVKHTKSGKETYIITMPASSPAQAHKIDVVDLSSPDVRKELQDVSSDRLEKLALRDKAKKRPQQEVDDEAYLWDRVMDLSSGKTGGRLYQLRIETGETEKGKETEKTKKFMLAGMAVVKAKEDPRGGLRVDVDISASVMDETVRDFILKIVEDHSAKSIYFHPEIPKRDDEMRDGDLISVVRLLQAGLNFKDVGAGDFLYLGGPASSPVDVARLIMDLDSHIEDKRMAAVVGLGNVRPTTDEILEALQLALTRKGETMPVRSAAALVLQGTGTEQAREILAKAKRHANGDVRTAISEAEKTAMKESLREGWKLLDEITDLEENYKVVVGRGDVLRWKDEKIALKRKMAFEVFVKAILLGARDVTALWFVANQFDRDDAISGLLKEGNQYMEDARYFRANLGRYQTPSVVRQMRVTIESKETQALKLFEEVIKMKKPELLASSPLTKGGKKSVETMNIYDEVTSDSYVPGSKIQSEKEVGGINLDPKLFDLQIKRDGNGVPLPLPQQPIGQMNIEGFIPVIINITPVTNLPLLLGLAETGGEAEETRPAMKAREPEEISALN